MTSNVSDPIKQIVQEHRALAIVRFLNGSLGGASNYLVLADCLELLGLACSSQDLTQTIDRLDRGGLVRVTYPGTLQVVELTSRGAEAAKGLVAVEGVLRPGPDCPY